MKYMKKSRFNSEMIRQIWKKSKLECETIWKVWMKCEIIWKILKTILKRYGKYGRKVN
jgi:hypothetical protein